MPILGLDLMRSIWTDQFAGFSQNPIKFYENTARPIVRCSKINYGNRYACGADLIPAADT
jgi:hypothetical protein